jgi:hypothetical protein
MLIGTYRRTIPEIPWFSKIAVGDCSVKSDNCRNNPGNCHLDAQGAFLFRI